MITVDRMIKISSSLILDVKNAIFLHKPIKLIGHPNKTILLMLIAKFKNN